MPVSLAKGLAIWLANEEYQQHGNCPKMSSSGDFTYVHSIPEPTASTTGRWSCRTWKNRTRDLTCAKLVTESPLDSAKLLPYKFWVHSYLIEKKYPHPMPPTFKEPFQTKTVTEESNTTLRCIATGHAPIVITWQKDKSLMDISKRGRYSDKLF
ncbi:down syndrome cell adhesion molecule [Caerostris extrusa]|uniref:Down syndrome cell adhesion molecule n=1 Tax=Caerostris extrusa TaxID=172846 RepID=A0AAV4SA19_CAEEX|nr:down syndrome cell adhesion molecule [Caerostris extrusa]